MARIADLSGAGSFAQAVTTWARSGQDVIGVRESIRESRSEFPCKEWRREGDSNPRYCLGTHAFQACALNHSAISPPSRLNLKKFDLPRNDFWQAGAVVLTFRAMALRWGKRLQVCLFTER